MSTDDWARVFAVLAVIDVAVTIELVRASRRVREPVLAERAGVSVMLTLFATAVALLSVAYLVDISVPSSISGPITLGALAVLSVPQLVWYLAYRTGRFG